MWLATLGLALLPGQGAPAPEPRRVDTPDGVRVAYEVHRPESPAPGRAAVVFVHGWACDRAYWREQLPAVAEERVAVALDLAGHGDTLGEREDGSLAALATDVVTVVEALELERVALVGHSMGGWVALEAARRMPERVLGVVGVDTLHDAGFRVTPEGVARMVAPYEEDYAGTMVRAVESMFAPGADPEVVAWVRDRAVATPPGPMLALMRAFEGLEPRVLFERAGVPIRAVNAAPPPAGAGQPTRVEANARVADFGARLVDEAGHFLMLERPEAFRAALAETLAELEDLAARDGAVSAPESG